MQSELYSVICNRLTSHSKTRYNYGRCTLPARFSLLQLSWSPDSSQVLTASGDKTCKIWDVETNSVVTYVPCCIVVIIVEQPCC